MNNILTNPPKIRKEEKKEVEDTYRFLLERNKTSLGAKNKKWQYIISGKTLEKEGFARSKTMALLKIKFSIIREEARLQKRQKKGEGVPLFLKAEEKREELFRLLGPQSKSLHNVKEDSLLFQEIKEDVFLLSASKPNFYGSSKTVWLAAIASKDAEAIFSEGRSRKAAEKEVLCKFQEKESAEEFDRMRQSLELKKGKKA